MNATNQPLVNTSAATRATIKVSFPLDRELHDQIASALAEVSTQLGLELTMPKFLRKTVVEGWKTQLDRYRKLDTTLRRRPV